ncbi:MAG: DUF3995 domain-containing protein [Bdellovibrionales bacterium]|nr:DUF3995 domain-containing protein [Bdellovibrionales bacterium]
MNYIAITLFFTLIFLATIHIYWAHGGLWPGENYQDLVDKVFGRGSKFPSPISCYLASLALLLTSLVPLAVAGYGPQIINALPLGPLMIFLGSIFGIRATLGYLPVIEKRWNPKFIKLNRKIYNPLCLVVMIFFLL